MTHPSATGGHLPTPPDFPVSFDSGEERLLWSRDRMHFPRPVTPMTAEFTNDASFNEAFEALGVPATVRSRRINTYHYDSFIPAPLSPAEAAEAGQRTEQQMGAAIARLHETWNGEMLPQVKAHLAFFEGFDLKNASLPALREQVEEAVRRHRELWGIHFRIVLPAMMAVSLFDEFYRDLFGSGGAFGAYRLTQGFDNLTLQAGRELWRLSRRALTMPEVRAVLETQAAREVMPALERSAEGRAFLQELRVYLAEYGQRGGEFFELADQSLLEDPTPLIKSLKDFAGQPDRDFEAEHAALAAEREQRVAEARAALQTYPQAVRDQFEFLLGAAQTGVVITEDHGFYIDFKSTYQIRQVLLEAGRRLAEAGALDAADDVFMLTLDELRAGLSQPAKTDHRALVAGRRAEMEHFAGVAPPPLLGTLPAGAPPDDPMNRMMRRFFGGPPQASEEPGMLRGNAGSPGKVTARARVMHSLAAAEQLQRGEVLVAETTAPPWTPLFGIAAAVVTDTGGVLSHCAVVAREYGVPAVVGVGMATATIRDGQWLEVDGDAGTVRMLE